MTGVGISVWRAVLAFRAAAAVFCLYLIARFHADYARPALGLVVAACIIVWTGLTGVVILTGRAHRPTFVLTDVVVVAGLTLLTMPVQTYGQSHGSMPTLTSAWAAAPALGAGILFGWRGGFAAAIVQGAVSIVVRHGYDGRTLTNVLLLVLAATTTGYVTQLLMRAETELAVAAAGRATADERDRLARSIHDGVLQVLALVQRRGTELGGEAAQLGKLAGEQEAALRALMTSAAHQSSSLSTHVDLAARLLACRAADVTVSVPAQPVLLDRHRADEMTAAVQAALDNVARHAGPTAHAWVLLEDLGDELVVTVRDDGVGMAPGRLAEAAAQGRLGVSASLRGRTTALGGRAAVTSAPGDGTEVEMRIPLPAAGPSGRARG
jgi:signal transduction histidine kinase